MDLKELAVAYWRLEKWVSMAPVEKKLAATSSLRNIKKFLDENNVEVLDPLGQKYDIGMAVDVVKNNIAESDAIPLIAETMKPIVMQNGSVIMFGQVIVDKEVKDAPVLRPLIPEDIKAEWLMKNVEKTKEAQHEKNEPQKVRKKGVPVIVPLLVLTLCVSIATMIFQITSKNALISTGIEETPVANNNEYKKIADDITNINEKLDTLLGNSTKENTNAQENEITFVRYEIVDGDSMISICNKNGLDYYDVRNEILNFNNIEDENNIYVGQIIYIPTLND